MTPRNRHALTKSHAEPQRGHRPENSDCNTFVDGLVAGNADYEGLPAHLGHEVRPRGLWLPWLREVGELGDLVDFHLGALLAPLAPARLEPGNELLTDLPRAFRTADLWSIHAADCCSRYSSWTCCGVRY